MYVCVCLRVCVSSRKSKHQKNKFTPYISQRIVKDTSSSDTTSSDDREDSEAESEGDGRAGHEASGSKGDGSTQATSHEEVSEPKPLADGVTSPKIPKEEVVEVKGTEHVGHGDPTDKTGTPRPAPNNHPTVSKLAVTHGSETDGTFVCK